MVTQRDPESARRRILDSAAGEFAAHGPAGARVDAIAAEAGINKRMLYHYFGDKQALFRAVLNDRLGGGRAMPTAAAVIEQGQKIDVVDVRLMVWASIGGLDPRPDEAWQQLLIELEEEQAAGRVRGDVDAQLLAVVVLGLSALPGLLPAYVGELTTEAGGSWTHLRKLLTLPVEKSASRGVRPRVRMLPKVRGR